MPAYRGDVFRVGCSCFLGPFVQGLTEGIASALLLDKEVDALSDGTRLASVLMGKLGKQLSFLVAEADRGCLAHRQECSTSVFWGCLAYHGEEAGEGCWDVESGAAEPPAIEGASSGSLGGLDLALFLHLLQPSEDPASGHAQLACEFSDGPGPAGQKRPDVVARWLTCTFWGCLAGTWVAGVLPRTCIAVQRYREAADSVLNHREVETGVLERGCHGEQP